MQFVSSQKVGRAAFALAVTAALVLLADTASQAGIQGSGIRMAFTLARVTSFNDGLVVDGTRFDTSRARVTINQEPGTTSQLQPGQVVAVAGEIDGSGSGVASDISYVSDVQGAISSVDVDGGTLTMLGQSIRVVESTMFGKGIHPSRIKGLRVGDAVSISAFASASGELVASRIERAVTGAVAQTRGAIQALDSSAHQFRINDLIVDYAAAVVNGSLEDGAVVTVRGAVSSSSGSLRATDVSVSAGIANYAGVAGAIEGLITQFDSSAQFEVNGQRVAAIASTRYELNGAQLNVDQSVDVTGRFDAAGVLVAERIKVEPQALSLVEGSVEAVSAAERTVRVLGVTILVGADTILEDRAKQPVHDFQLSDLRVGDFVQVRGVRHSADELAASLLERDDPKSQPKGQSKEQPKEQSKEKSKEKSNKKADKPR